MGLLMTYMTTIELDISTLLIMVLSTVFMMIIIKTIMISMKSQIHITPSFIFNQVITITMMRTTSSIMTSVTNILKLITEIIMLTIHLRRQVIITTVYHTMKLSLMACLTMTNSHTTTDILTSTSTWPITAKWVMITMKICHIIESWDTDTQMTIQWINSSTGNGLMTNPIQDMDTICMDLTTGTTDTLLMPRLSMVIMQTHT
jgi:hypothetical protein